MDNNNNTHTQFISVHAFALGQIYVRKSIHQSIKWDADWPAILQV